MEMVSSRQACSMLQTSLFLKKKIKNIKIKKYYFQDRKTLTLWYNTLHYWVFLTLDIYVYKWDFTNFGGKIMFPANCSLALLLL